jgi:predicted transcriptional regulator
VLVKSPDGSSESHLGVISDRRLLAYFSAFARSSSGTVPPLPSVQPSSSFLRYVSNPLSSLPLPSLNLHSEVVAVHSRNSVLDAMRMMSEMGVSSVAVLEEEGGSLLSAISVTDIGQVGTDHLISAWLLTIDFQPTQTVVPSQSNQILTTPIQQLVSQVKVRSRFQ